MEKVQSSSNYGTGIAVAVFLIAASVFLLVSPFSLSYYQEDGKDYILKFHYFGHWSLHEGGEMVNDGGLENYERALGLTNFPVYSSALIMVGLVLSYIFCFIMAYYISKSHEYFNKHRRYSGIGFICANTIGLVGTLLQIPFMNYLGTVYESVKISTGFIVAIIFFSLFIVVGTIPIFIPDRFTKIRTKKREEPSEIVVVNN